MPAVTDIRVLPLESRRALELPLADLMLQGELAVFPHVESKGLLFLQFRKGKVTLTAGKYVGLIPLTPGITIDVRPKLPVSNLARILDRARISLDAINGVDRLYLAEGLPSDSVLEFLLANFISSLQPVIQRGIYKDYVRYSTIVSHPRGRIKLAQTFQACWSRGVRHKASTEHFTQTADTAVNRVLKGALRHLLSAVQKKQSAAALVRQANRVWNDLPRQIGDLMIADLYEARLIAMNKGLPASRAYYYRALEIALLILRGRSVSLDAFGDDVVLESFIIDFEQVFEQYLRQTLHELMDSGLVVRDGNAEGKRPLYDDRNDPPAQPDIVISRVGPGSPLVVEVKYKEKPERGDINQAITYAVAYRTTQVVLVHQRKPGAPKGLRKLGEINGISVNAFAFDLGRADIESEEAEFANAMMQVLEQAEAKDAA